MKIAVGLSGGVDSAVAALMLKRAGHEVTGVTMKLWREGLFKGGPRDACFGPGEAGDISAAESFCASIGIAHRVFDCSEEYMDAVLDYFKRERMAGRTPNPCVVCNRRLKFGFLPEIASRSLEFERFATGHYAQIVERSGRLAVARASDSRKDQSYFLWGLSQQQLSRAMFPLGQLSKDEVRRIAREASLPMAEKADSQDFYSGDCNELIGAKDMPGDIVSTDGRILGRHNGFWHYTIGQRKNLGIAAGEPLYVVSISKERNEVAVGTRAEAVSTAFRISDMNWMAAEPGSGRIEGLVKIRSTGSPVGPAVLDGDVVRAPDGLFGVTPGQSAVLYSPEGAILCGGVIDGPATDDRT